MGSVQTAFNALLAKLDADSGVNDTDYVSTLATSLSDTVDIQGGIIFPPTTDPEEAERNKILTEYFTQIRRALIEIESKLP